MAHIICNNKITTGQSHRNPKSLYMFIIILEEKHPVRNPSSSKECLSKYAYTYTRTTNTHTWQTQNRYMAHVHHPHDTHIYVYIYICMYVCMYVCIYAVVLLSGPSLAFWGVIIWAKFAFYKTLFVKKHYKIGVSAPFFCWKKKCAQIWGVIIWANLGQVGHF